MNGAGGAFCRRATQISCLAKKGCRWLSSRSDAFDRRSAGTRLMRLFLREHEWSVLAVLALAALVLGTWGFADREPNASLVSDVYAALALFPLQSGLVTHIPLQLDIARFLA